MTSVEDGTVETSIPCQSASDPTEGGWSLELTGGHFLTSVPADLVDRVDPTDGRFVVATHGGATQDQSGEVIWSTATCDSGHVVMNYGHEDPESEVSVYDGSVTTTVAC